MDTFGDRLRCEREGRGLSIETVAEILRVDRARLHALERNDFDGLPDDAVMMRCIEAYAECLQVDAGLMFEDYVRERDRCQQKLEASLTPPRPTFEVPPASLPPHLRAGRPTSPWLAAGALIAAVGVLGALWLRSGDDPAPPPVASPTPLTPVEAAPASPQKRSESAASRDVRAAAPATLSVPEHGVGTAIKRRELRGRGERFAEGKQVWFWTRVQGGGRGDRIEHVWLREGVETARIPLEIGGSSWRTYSSKTLHAGAAGSWAVEVRDEAGRVLARREFACVR